MGNCLFIGNGLNLTLDNYSWDNLLKIIADYAGTERVEGISLPLEFERLMNIKISRNPGLKDKDIVYSRAKARVISPLKKLDLKGSPVHNLLKDVPCDSIITTNYDFMLEKVFDPNFSSKESYEIYCDHKTSLLGNIEFYHPHGSVASTKSICLGYEHYVKLLNHIRNEMDANGIAYILDNPINIDCKWYHKFFTDNVYIFGFGLSESEIDIWSLITKRASLYYRDKSGLQSRITNTITYYEIINDIEKDAHPNVAKLALLEAEHVEVKIRYLSEYKKYGDSIKEVYKKAYTNIIADISEEIKWQD